MRRIYRITCPGDCGPIKPCSETHRDSNAQIASQFWTHTSQVTSSPLIVFRSQQSSSHDKISSLSVQAIVISLVASYTVTKTAIDRTTKSVQVARNITPTLSLCCDTTTERHQVTIVTLSWPPKRPSGPVHNASGTGGASKRPRFTRHRILRPHDTARPKCN